MKQKEIKITLISIFFSAIGIVVTLYSWYMPHGNGYMNTTVINIPSSNVSASSSVDPVYSATSHYIKKGGATSSREEAEAILAISAAGADVRIEEGDQKFPYHGGTISSPNADQIVYLPKNQRLTVNLSGAGVNLSISRIISKQVNVINTGAGNQVTVF